MGTTLTALSVAFNLNAAGVKSGATLARNEISNLGRILKAQESTYDKFDKDLNTLERALKSGVLPWDRYRQEVDKLKTAFRSTGPAALKAADDQRKLTEAMRQGEIITRQYLTAQERHRLALQDLGRLYRGGAINAATYNRALEAEATALRTATAEQQRLNSAVSSASSVYSRLVSVFAALGVARLAKDAVMLAADFESVNIQFEVLLGSTEKAVSAIAEMRRFAAASPLTFTDVAKGVKTMVAFGVEADRAMTAMKMLGDISLGNADRFGSLALAFGQVSAAGRLMGAEVLQFVNAGFNPLQEISRTTGQSMRDLKKAMEDGLISSDMVYASLATATTEGGKFADMTDRLADTASGKMAQALDQLQQLGIKIGNELIPVLTDVLAILKDMGTESEALVNIIGRLSEGTRVFVGIYRDFGSVVDAALKGAEGVGKLITGDVEAAMKLQAEGRALGYAGITGTATGKALDNAAVQSNMRADAFKQRKIESQIKPVVHPSVTNAQLREKGDWAELSKRQEAANKLAMQRRQIAQQQLLEQKKTNENLKQIKPVQRYR